MSVVYSCETDLIGPVPFAPAKILKGNRVIRALKHLKNNTSIQILPQIVVHRLLTTEEIRKIHKEMGLTHKA